MLFGDPSAAAAADAVAVRDLSNFHWSFIALLAVVFYIYGNELKKKNYKSIVAALSLYGVHWLYEIANAVICHVSGYALWTVSNASTSLVLLIGVSWELSMMFSVAGMIAWNMLPEDRTLRVLGMPIKWVVAIGMALLFSAVEIFLAATPAFIWVYPWWGAIPVFITTYIPFFIAAIFVPDRPPKFQKRFLITVWGLVALLLAVLIPLGVI